MITPPDEIAIGEATEHPIDEAARLLGGRAALAAALNVTVGAVGNWTHRKSGVPHKYCPRIEALVPSVTRRRLRPNDFHEMWPELARTEQSPGSTDNH